MVYFAFENGTFMVSPECDFGTPPAAPKAIGADETASKALKTAAAPDKQKTGRRLDRGKTGSGAEDDSDDETIDFEHSEKSPKKAKISFVDDEADEVDDDSRSKEPTDAADTLQLDQADDDGDDNYEDDPALDAPYRSIRSPLTLPEPQPAFSPSSTPLDLPRRIMCWNHRLAGDGISC